jgi:hypothetical protein
VLKHVLFGSNSYPLIANPECPTPTNRMMKSGLLLHSCLVAEERSALNGLLSGAVRLQARQRCNTLIP